MIPFHCSQLIVTLVPDEQACKAVLSLYEKNKDRWIKTQDAFPAVIGRSGITWDKKEGDGKTPAGAYPLIKAFGKKENQSVAFPFIAVHETLEAVDDPNSSYYNQIVDRRSLKSIDWKSSEKMLEIGSVYDLGVEIGYNSPPIAGKGSCIFIHVWRMSSQGTGGCTAMPLERLQQIVSWLDEKKNPYIVQLPIQEAWRLPVELRSP